MKDYVIMQDPGLEHYIGFTLSHLPMQEINKGEKKKWLTVF